MAIRRAREGDLPQILEILNREILEGVAHFAIETIEARTLASEFERFASTYPWVVAAEDDGTVLGVARASPWKSRGAYERTVEIGVYVRAEAQGRGIATAIYGTFLSDLRNAGFHTVLGGVALPNDPSVRLHEKFGFRHVGTLPQVGFKKGKWRDVGYWALVFDD